ncbi:hypothetical protein A1F96_09569 [Pyrenophora tritici-repentis]|nr:hypothetical protein A1F96_09569 [Pyrenophora tritici-repentis]
MTSQQQVQKLARAKARRAANNNYQRLIKTLYSKLEKLSEVYNADIYFVARRNGRIVECASADVTGRRPWSPPNRAALRRSCSSKQTGLVIDERERFLISNELAVTRTTDLQHPKLDHRQIQIAS